MFQISILKIPFRHRRATALLVGMLISCLFFVCVSQLLEPFLKIYVKNTVDLENFRDYYLFDPESEGERKYAFISSSFYAGNDIMNQGDGTRHVHPSGYIGQLANHVLSTEYDTDVRFYDFGRSGTYPFDHLWFFYRFLQAPGAEGVLYTAGFENIHAPMQGQKIDRNYVTLAVLAAMAERYPDMKPQLRILEDYILDHLDLSRDEIEDILKEKIDPETLLLKAENRGEKARLASVTDGRESDVWAVHSIVSRLRDSILRLFLYTLTDQEKKWSEAIRQQYSDALPEYGKPIHDKPNRITNASINTTKGRDEVEAAFYELLIGITESEGLNIVFYHPPMYILTPYQYWEVLKPNFFDRFQKTYADEKNVYFIDHVFLPNINHFDFIYKHRRVCEGPCKYGYDLGIIGNIKRVRALLNELEKVEILDEVDETRFLTSFAEETSVPKIPMCFKIIGLEEFGCIYKSEDYEPDSNKARLPLREIVNVEETENTYINKNYFSIGDE
jgi:hypothetical protein